MLAVGTFQADVGLTILFGLLVGFPTAALAGPIYAFLIAPRIVLHPENPMEAQLEGTISEDMPGFGISVFTVMIPVVLMLLASAADFVIAATNPARPFFFSGRRRHTRWNCDWSSDVCSSDLDSSSAATRRRRAISCARRWAKAA